METKRAEVNFNVDIIRTLAILMVIFLHCSDFPYRFYGNQISSLDVMNWFSTDIFAAIGRFGVPLFIMLAGALLLVPEKADQSARVFYKKRFNRIGLPFIFWTIAYFIWDFYAENYPVTTHFIIQGLLSGSYSILWFLYLLIGLYAVTPMLRVMVKYLKRSWFTLLIILWFIGTTTSPLIHTLTDYTYTPLMFVFMDWTGYFLLGIYLLKTKISLSKASLIAILGFLISVLGDWWVTATYGEKVTGVFHDYMSFGIMLGSAGLFLVLLKIPANRLEKYDVLNQIIRWISKNTLPIYLFHVMILEGIRQGVFGFYLINTGYDIIDVPLWTFITFSISALILYPLKKIPILKRLLG